MHSGRARTLSGPEELGVRLARLNEPHVALLNGWVRTQTDKRGLRLPYFDPGDAGAEAQVLFLLESPGPMADAGQGSGLISIDNDDPTAANLWGFRKEANLLRGAAHWNAVPWYLGRDGRNVVAPGEQEMKRAIGMLRSLLPLFPALEAVVPMGNVAKRVWGRYCDVQPNNLVVLPTWHPSALGLARPRRREDVARAIRLAALVIDQTPREPLQPRRADPLRRVPQRAGKSLADLGRRGQQRFKSVRNGPGS